MKKILIHSVLFLLPVVTFAQGSPGTDQAMAFVDSLNRVILFPLIGLLLAVAFFAFLLGCAQYIMGANNPMAREKGVKNITYGIIGLVIMVSAWAILSIAAGTFGLQGDLDDIQDGNLQIPTNPVTPGPDGTPTPGPSGPTTPGPSGPATPG